MDLTHHLVLAQTAPGALPFDPTTLTTYGPLGAIVVLLIWYIGKLQDRMDKMVEAHKVEIAAERALNKQQQDERLADQKTLIPLGTSIVAATEQLVELQQRMATK